MKDLVLFSNIALNAQARRETLDSIEYLVVPAIAIKEGVLNNIFYPASELESFVQSWNGVPIPVNHPEKDGNYVTANSTEVEQSSNIGRFYNVFYDADSKSVKGEIWINILKARRLGYSDIVDSLEAGDPMEVSTGLLGNTVEGAGSFNGKDYTSTIVTIRPDHLAILPDSPGACSLLDGCGAMRTNCGDDKKCSCKTKKPDTDVKPKTNTSVIKRVLGWFGVNQEKSFDSIRKMVAEKLYSTYGEEPWPYIVDLFDDKVVFEQKGETFSQEYTLEDEGTKLTLLGQRQAVSVEVVYKPVLTNKKQKQNMEPKKKASLVSALALAMVANVADAVTDDSKVSLAALPDEMLRNMATQYKLNEDGTPVTEKPASSVPTASPVTNSATDTISNDERQLLNSLKAERELRLSNKRKKVTELNEHITNEIAATLSEAALDAMLANAGEADIVNFAPAGAIANSGSDAPRVAPGIFLAPITKS